MKPGTKSAGATVGALLLAAALFCTPLLAATAQEDTSGETDASETNTASEASAADAGDTAQPAEATQNGSTTGFHVRAGIPENQINTNLSYFNLMMQPGQQQVLEVEVVNEGDAEITVDVSAISASTNPNGIIDYKTPDVQDETLQNPFAGLAEVLDTSIQIPAGGTGLARVQVTMPASEYDGDILGGLVFTKRAPGTDMDETENGAMIQNVYSYVLGVILRENDNEVKPDFELLGVETNLFDNEPSFIHSIRNREPYIVKYMQVTATVYAGADTQGTPVATRTQELVDMAPNSVLEFAVVPGDGTLEGGTYTSEVVLQLDGEEWRFAESFMVQDEEATLVNDLAPFATPASAEGAAADTGISRTTLVVIILVLLVLVAVLVAALLLRRGKGTKNKTMYRK